MADRFEVQLRRGLVELLEPEAGAYPRWATSPAAARIAEPRQPQRLPWRVGLGSLGIQIGPASRARLAWAIVAAILLVLAVLGGLWALGSQLNPSPAMMCAAGSTPDVPGPVDQPRPPIIAQTGDGGYAGPIVWDGENRRLVLLPRGYSPAWTFDVCTNTWTAMTATTAKWSRPPGVVAFDEDSGLTVAIGDNTVAAYDLTTDTWTEESPAPMWAAEAAYDPRSGSLLVWDGLQMWTYEVDSDTWETLPQGLSRPPRERSCGFEFLDYDVLADRVVLYSETCASSGPETWLFDPRNGAWSKADVETARVSQFIGNDQMVYDATSGRSVAYAGGRVAAYDAVANAWEVLFDAAPGTERFDRFGNAYAFDPLNGRLVVVGGSYRSADEWRGTDDVVAFDVRTRTWIELLAPSRDERGQS
jgi:hypothetical protein